MASCPILPTSEDQRLAELHTYQILDTQPEDPFERLVAHAQRLFGVPTALISFVAEDRQWFKAKRGFDARATDLRSSFCVHAIKQDSVLVVLDALEDERFATLPVAAGEPFVRFYAGAPLVTPKGHRLGTFCLLDTSPRTAFSARDEATLTELASLTIDILGMRLAAREDSTGRTLSVLESITEAFYTLDRDWRFTYVNTQAEHLLDRNRTELIGKKLWDEFPETKNSRLRDDFLQAAATQRSFVLEYHSASRSTWSEIHAYPSPEGMSVYLQNIDGRKANERREQVQTDFRRDLLAFTQTSLQHELNEDFYQQLLTVAVRTIPGAQAGSLVVRKGEEFHFVAASGFELEPLRACTFTMADLQFDVTTPAPKLVRKWKDEELGEDRQDLLETYGLTRQLKVSMCMPILVDSKPLVVLYLDNFDNADVFDDDAIEMAHVLAQQAASLVKRLELETALRMEREAFEHAANHDALTGLPNRHFLGERLENALSQARLTGQPLAVMFIDLDNFKDVNDTFGHSFGDALIRAVAARCTHALRQGDVLARWGGDEFVVVLPEVAHARVAGKIAERILANLGKPFKIDGQEIRTSASVGVAMCENGSGTAENLIKNADIALYRAKTERGSYVFFTDDLQQVMHRRIELGEDLRCALDAGTLTLHYQPRVSFSDGRVTSLEALARWYHPARGMVSPAIFVPLAEELGLIRKLGSQVLRAACAQARAWRDSGRPRRIAINVSAQQLKDPSFVAEVSLALKQEGLDPRMLELEITESSAMDELQENIERLTALRNMGVHIAIDDFGTAYSSLSQLRRLPLDSLKIDQSFVRDLPSDCSGDANSLAIVRMIIMLGHSLGLKVVAEGVETDAQRVTLGQLGCDEAQGYLFARPAPAAELE